MIRLLIIVIVFLFLAYLLNEYFSKGKKEKFNFKQSAKDILISSQLRTALILNKNIKASNYQIDVAGNKIDADVSLSPMYDPKSIKVKN